MQLCGCRVVLVALVLWSRCCVVVLLGDCMVVCSCVRVIVLLCGCVVVRARGCQGYVGVGRAVPPRGGGEVGRAVFARHMICLFGSGASHVPLAL